MRVPKTFSEGLTSLYEGYLTFDQFIQQEEKTLRNLAKYSNRFNTSWMVSDNDDLFQDACMFLVRAVWEYDESRGRSLVDYVCWNIGARLKTQVRDEKNRCRHPDPNTSRRIDVWSNPYCDNNSNIQVEAIISSNQYLNPETMAATREAFSQAHADMSDLANELVVVLIEENGNLAGSARRLIRRKHIRQRFRQDANYLKYWLKEHIMPEIFDNLSPNDIIPSDTLSNG